MLPESPSPLQSRKFLMSMAQLAILVILPLIYKHFEVSDDILMTVLISSSSLVGVYTGFNVIQKKFENQ